MNKDRYSLSFTTGGLFHHESIQLAALYLDKGDWNAVQNKVIAENLLQSRTINTLKRICCEVISRLKMLSLEELTFLTKANHQEQSYLLWIAVCRRYQFIADFALEVLNDRYITLKTDVRHEDFDSFFNQKAEWHAELDAIKPATQKKLRQVLFKILRDVGLINSKNIINAALLTPKLLDIILHGNRQDVLYFPVFETDLQGMIQ